MLKFPTVFEDCWKLLNMSSELSSKAAVLAFVILIGLVALSGIVLRFSIPEPTLITIHPPQPTETSAPTPTPAPILVYVTGAVAQPDRLYQLPFGSRVKDVLEAAGGMTASANRMSVNLAAIVRDGDQIHVLSNDKAEGDIELPTPSGGWRVHINTATQSQLETLPGIGAATARRIIEYRELVGAFASLADLDNVSGIGPATLDSLKDLVAFD